MAARQQAVSPMPSIDDDTWLAALVGGAYALRVYKDVMVMNIQQVCIVFVFVHIVCRMAITFSIGIITIHHHTYDPHKQYTHDTHRHWLPMQQHVQSFSPQPHHHQQVNSHHQQVNAHHQQVKMYHSHRWSDLLRNNGHVGTWQGYCLGGNKTHHGMWVGVDVGGYG